MTDSPILYTEESHVAVITLNRPEQMNALNQQMIHQLEEIISKIKNDACVRVVVLRAVGDAFMSGTDFYEIHNEMDFALKEIPHLMRQFNAVIMALREIEKPVLAVVHGLVAGMGMSLMLAADLVLASELTRFSFNYCHAGTSPAGGVSFNLPRLIGNKKAMELLLLSDVFDAEDAMRLGLINWSVPKEEITYHMRKIVDSLVSGPTVAFAQTKQLINSSSQNKLSIQMELEVESFTKTIHSRDFKSAVSALINKRVPEFEGR